MSSARGDLIDQLREWWERLRERLAGRLGERTGARPVARRTMAGRRPATRAQAIPQSSHQGRAGLSRRVQHHRLASAERSERAERTIYTLVFAAVLVALVVGLFFTLSWLLGFGGQSSAPPTPGAAPGQLPNPAAISSPLPVVSPSPSPSPDSGLAPAPSGRIHVVEAGDTLNRIAQRYGVTVEAIMQANNFTDRNRILRIGERLVIPEPR